MPPPAAGLDWRWCRPSANQGLVRFRFIEQALNAALFLEFLGQLIADQPQSLLILDNLKVHHAKLVTEWVGEHAGANRASLLAALYPRRNPTEYLNRDFKTQLRLSARSSTPQALRHKANAFLNSSSIPQSVS
ncbi:MAG: transposase [Candidatus Competibacteraceae bacterium]|nr:transposase [Candidatus Competibacteraceae bacterium]